MKRSYLAFIAALPLTILASCASEPDLAPAGDVLVEYADEPSENLVAGTVLVKVTEEFAESIEANTDESGRVLTTKVKAMESAVKSMGIVRMKRLFPDAGEFEARTRAEGLHLWYVLDYDEGVAVTRSCSELTAIPGIQIVEFQPRIEIVGGYEVEECAAPSPTAAAADMPFDDPRLKDQWHYFNDGSASGSQSGCDVNVFPVWENYTTGSPDVIVGVVDGGIDFQHEDLADNMWHNPSQRGDGQYGFNFISKNYVVTPHDHGTHVAGTIAAVNNNGKGVCGIAGGNKAKRVEGVKLMSCQIFDAKGGSGSGPEAIKWSADHGAVISQNSWGYVDISSTPSALKEAVDYFVKYAGYDANGKQVGPMAGGLVVFAAGNENRSMDYTAAIDAVVAVASVGADYRRAYYSNYGSWVDISAPGGDAKRGNQVYSTLPGNKYGLMQGTSMACPHVSGVAALLVSKLGGPGFTAEALKKRLLTTTTDISSFNRAYGMGSGLVNAYAAIAGTGGAAPDEVKDLTATAQSNNVDFSLTIPRDSDDNKPYTISVYYSTSTITDLSKAMFGTFYVGSLKAGATLTGRLTGLDFNTKYYLRAVAKDMTGNASKPGSQISVTTGDNSAPVIRLQGEESRTIKMHESTIFNFEVEEPDGHFCYLELNKGCKDAETLDTMRVRMSPSIVVNGFEGDAGTFSSTLVVTDYYGMQSTKTVHYTILPNHAPRLVGQVDDQVFSKKGVTIQLPAEEYIIDDDGEELRFEVENSNVDVVSVNQSEGIIYITSIGFGYADITMKAMDLKGESVSQSFRVLVRDGQQPVDVYPNPVSDYLYVRTDKNAQVRLSLINISGATVLSCTQDVSPFSPAKIDVSGIPSGVYTVVVDVEGEVTRRTIAKI